MDLNQVYVSKSVIRREFFYSRCQRQKKNLSRINGYNLAR
jgi:hypothetical protein